MKNFLSKIFRADSMPTFLVLIAVVLVAISGVYVVNSFAVTTQSHLGSSLNNLVVGGGALIAADPVKTGLVVVNGNVGIGAPEPEAKLAVVGDLYIDNVDWVTDKALRIREGLSDAYGAFFKYGDRDLLTIGTRNYNRDFVAMEVERGSLDTIFKGNVSASSNVWGNCYSKVETHDCNNTYSLFCDEGDFMIGFFDSGGKVYSSRFITRGRGVQEPGFTSYWNNVIRSCKP